MSSPAHHLTAALAHAAAGRPVFPCGPHKRPLTPKGFKDATRDSETIRQWWTEHPEALIGMPTGRSSRVFALDIDNDQATGKDGDSALASLEAQHGRLPETVESLTPRGGRHKLFRHPGPDVVIPNSASKLGPNLDIRGDGGYIILPPSRLPDGRGYEWEGSSDPDEGVRAADAPPWLLALVARTKTAPVAPTTGPAPDRIPGGRRNAELFSLARSLRAKGLTGAGILAALRAENAARCEPPLDDAEVSRIAASAATKAPGRSPEFEASRGTGSAPPPANGPAPRPVVAAKPAENWPEPADLSPAWTPEPYPIDAFPDVARRVVVEYQAFARMPMAMCASAALAQMALATQALADVARNEQLVSPISLNLLVIADSGERKSAADKTFGRPSHDWEKREREARTSEYRRVKAMEKAWQSRVDGCKRKITAEAGKGSAESAQEVERLTAELIGLEERPIIAPPLPTLFYEDATPAALAYSLAVGWPSAGLFADEGGVVVGGHGMGEDSATAMLSLLNVCWGASDFTPTRKQAATAELRGRRFSAFLMIQHDLLPVLIQKGARNIGFVARFLLSAPISTMGTRLYRDPPDDWRAIGEFSQSIERLLNLPLPIDDSGTDRGLLMRLRPPVMRLSPAAKRAFVEYHDAVEQELCEFGEFEVVKDVASKSAENACRVAAVCQIFERGKVDWELDADYLRSGVAIAAWHLGEARRVFLEADAPEPLSDARVLSTWLASKARTLTDTNGEPILTHSGELAVREITRFGPNRVRDTARRDAAIEELEKAGHVRRCDRGRQNLLLINPKLLTPR